MQLPKAVFGPFFALLELMLYIERMSKDLEAKKKLVSDEFDQLETQKQQIIQRQFELRGKFQAYEEDEAKTIVAEPKKKGE